MIKKSLVCLSMIILLLCSGCVKEKTDEEVFNDIQKTLIEMEGYSCRADIEMKSNTKTHSYTMIHKYKAPNKYLIQVLEPKHLEGKITIYNGEKTIVKQPKINQSWEINSFNKTPEAKSFLGSFIYSIMNNERVGLNREEVDGIACLRIDTIIPGDHPYYKTMKIWMSVKDNTPAEIRVFDKENIERIIIKYSDFKLNDKLDDSVFTFKAQ